MADIETALTEGMGRVRDILGAALLDIPAG